MSTLANLFRPSPVEAHMFAWLKSRPAPALDEFHLAVAAYADRWYGACVRITRDHGLAEDAVQDALSKAWQKRYEYRGEAQMETWIHRIAINCALDLVRRQHPAMVSESELMRSDEQVDAHSPVDICRVEEFGDGLSLAMKRLTRLERLCFVLKHVEQWRLAEIAAELDCSESCIKQAVFRAVRKLRVALDPWRREAS